jgi:hypothetical protein
MSRSLSLVALCLLTISWASVCANESAESPVECDALIRRLDANEFSQRQDASDKLAQLGSAAFPSLEQAAKSDSREVSQRSLEILKKHYQSADTPTKQAAKQSLERLAQGMGSRAGRLAEEILNPPPPLQYAPQVVVRPRVNRVAAANIRMNIAPGGFTRRMHVRNNNGVKEIELQENGKKVKIVDDPKQGIQVEVTEKKDGKETTQKYAAKDAEELKQKHPDAHKIYDEIGKQNNGAQIRIGGAQLRPLLPGQAIPAQPIPVDAAQARAQQMEAMQRALQNLDRHIEQLQRDMPDHPDLPQHISRVQEHRKRLEKMQNEIGKDAP